MTRFQVRSVSKSLAERQKTGRQNVTKDKLHRLLILFVSVKRSHWRFKRPSIPGDSIRIGFVRFEENRTSRMPETGKTAGIRAASTLNNDGGDRGLKDYVGRAALPFTFTSQQ